jgi:hypothetical protein
VSHTTAIEEWHSSSCIPSAVVWLTAFCSGGALMIVRTVVMRLFTSIEMNFPPILTQISNRPILKNFLLLTLCFQQHLLSQCYDVKSLETILKA